MDQDQLKYLEKRLEEIRSLRPTDFLQTATLGTADSFEELAPLIESALEIIAMMPISGLNRLPEPAFRAVAQSLILVSELDGKIQDYIKKRHPAIRDRIRSMARELPTNVMNAIIPALTIHHAQQSAPARSSRSYIGHTGPWNLLAPLGEGGQGTVSRAWNPSSRMAGALKRVNPEGWRDRDRLLTRLRSEVEALDKLRHPNILQMLDYGEDPEPFIVTQIAALGTLHDFLPALRGDAALVILLSTCAANGIKYAHSHEIVHRDIKPKNLFLLSPNVLAVGDFGILWEEQQAHRLTTFAREGFAGDRIFAPPEAVETGYVPTNSFDVYSLGATMHCALAGQYPGPYWRIAGDDYKPLSVLLDNSRLAVIDNLLRPMLSKEPSARPTIGDVCDELSRLTTFQQGNRKQDYCPQCGGSTIELSVSDSLHFKSSSGTPFYPKARRCGTCRLLTIYTQ